MATARVVSQRKAPLRSEGREEGGGASQHGEKPTVGARLPFGFRRHWLFAEEVIKSGPVPA